MFKLGLTLGSPSYSKNDYRHLETTAAQKKVSWKP